MATELSNYATRVKYNLNYEHKDITYDVSGRVISLVYTDVLEGRASSLEIHLEDKDKQWAGAWYPEVGDEIRCLMGIEGTPMVDCGSFFVDEFECSADRNGVVTIVKGLSVQPKHINAPLRVKSYEGKALSEVANEIVSELGMAVSGALEGVVRQNSDKTGLALLFEISKKMGLVMKIEKNTVHFESYEKLKSKPTILINYDDIISVHIKDKSQGVYNQCTCRWWDAKTNTLYTGTHALGIKGGVATIWEKVEDNSKAEERAKNWLEDKQKQKAEIKIEMFGDVRFLAGVGIELKGFGKKDGKYIIKESKHEISRKGYMSNITLQL